MAGFTIQDSSVYAVISLQNEEILNKMYTVGEKSGAWSGLGQFRWDDVADSLTA